MADIKANLEKILSQIRQCEQQYQRKPNSVFLLAASKKQSIEKMQQAIAAGQLAFGENYLQEALAKMAVLTNHEIEWHFIGPIQRNKTRKIAEHFDWVHSVDDPIIANRLSEQRPDHLPPLNMCIEVNVSAETSKSGVSIERVEELVQHCVNLPKIKLRGLMTIPAIKNTFIEQRAEFYKLRLIEEILNKKGYKLDTLSMGMSQDMVAAIAEHTTIVRIGTNLFGPRN
jgi:hypothetical protein